MQTTITVDVGVIMASLAPTIAIIVAAILARLNAKRTEEKLTGIHKLVNSSLTAEMGTRLDLLRAQRVLLEKLIGQSDAHEDTEVLADISAQIRRLTEEIKNRDQVADSLTKKEQ